LEISECPLTNWDNRFKDGYSAIRRDNVGTDQVLKLSKKLNAKEVDKEIQEHIEMLEHLRDAKELKTDEFEARVKELKDSRDSKLIAKLDYDAWDLLYIDFQNNVKKDDDFKAYMRDLERYVKLMIRYRKSERMSEGVKIHDASITNDIQMMEAMVLKYERNLGQGLTVNKMLTKLRRLEGRHIDKKDLTVLDYFDLIEEHSKN